MSLEPFIVSSNHDAGKLTTPMRLVALPERIIGTKRVEDYSSPHFFATNF